MTRRKTNRKNNNIGKIILFVLFFLMAAVVVQFVTSLDQRMLPTALQAADMMAKSRVNVAISNSIKDIIEEQGLISEDFYVTSVGEQGKVNTLSVNTVLINQLCGDIAVNISESLNNLDSEKIEIPYGTLLGMDIFSNIGPKYTITVLPMGDAVVDYKSSFESVGINQINFQIWLDVDSTIQIINPLQQSQLNITRKIVLVNTIINSEVPQSYFNTSDNLKKIIE